MYWSTCVLQISLLLLLVALFCGSSEARQLRISRYSDNIEEDNGDGEVAVVEEVQPTPYPPAGYRPGRAFHLPGEEAEGSGFDATTTTTEYSTYTSTTTTPPDTDTTTQYDLVPAELSSDNVAQQGRAAKAPYPAAGFRPSRAFLLPTEVKAAAATTTKADNDSDVLYASTTTAIPTTTEQELADTTTVTPTTLPKAPYPPAGYRPSRAFLLPTELAASFQDSSVSVNEPEPPVSPADKAGHPACGVSDNPIAPKPKEGAGDNPDAERVFVTANVAPPVLAPAVPHAVPLVIRAQPLLARTVYITPVAHARPFAYSATLQSW